MEQREGKEESTSGWMETERREERGRGRDSSRVPVKCKEVARLICNVNIEVAPPRTVLQRARELLAGEAHSFSNLHN